MPIPKPMSTNDRPTMPMNRWGRGWLVALATGLLGCSDPEAQRELNELRERVESLEGSRAVAQARADSDLGPVAQGFARNAEHHHARISVNGFAGCGVDGGEFFQGRTLVQRSGTSQCLLPNLGLRSFGRPCPSDYDVLVEVAPTEPGEKVVTHRLEVRDRRTDSQGGATHSLLQFDCGHPAFVSEVFVFGPGEGGSL